MQNKVYYANKLYVKMYNFLEREEKKLLDNVLPVFALGSSTSLGLNLQTLLHKLFTFYDGG